MHHLGNTHPMQTWAKCDIFKPKALTVSVSLAETKPTCFTKVNKYSKWRAAMSEEFFALQQQGTWSFVSTLPHMNVVGCMWIFRIQYNPDGSISRYKARLVAKGYHQGRC